MKKTLTCLALACLVTAGPAFADKYFKWTDAKGVTHYSDAPPPPDAASTGEVKVTTRLPSDSESAVERLEKQRAETLKNLNAPATAAAPAKVDKSQYTERCKQLRANLQTMQNSGRVKEQDEKGETRVLTEEEKKQRMDDAERQIKAFCD